MCLGNILFTPLTQHQTFGLPVCSGISPLNTPCAVYAPLEDNLDHSPFSHTPSERGPAEGPGKSPGLAHLQIIRRSHFEARPPADPSSLDSRSRTTPLPKPEGQEGSNRVQGFAEATVPLAGQALLSSAGQGGLSEIEDKKRTKTNMASRTKVPNTELH